MHALISEKQFTAKLHQKYKIIQRFTQKYFKENYFTLKTFIRTQTI